MNIGSRSMAHKRRCIPSDHIRHNNDSSSRPTLATDVKRRCAPRHHSSNFSSPSVAMRSTSNSPRSSLSCHMSNCVDTCIGTSRSVDTSTITGNGPVANEIDNHNTCSLSAASCSGLLAATTTTTQLLNSGGPVTRARVIDGLGVTFIEEDSMASKQVFNRWRRSPAAATQSNV